MSDANKKLIRQIVEDIWNKGNVQLVNELFSKECVFHDQAFSEPIRGIEAYKNLVTAFRAGFPDLRLRIDDLIAEGDGVACRYTASGTNSGELKFGNLTTPATRKRAEWTGVTIVSCKDGKCVEEYIYGDSVSFRQQLGLTSETPSRKMHA